MPKTVLHGAACGATISVGSSPAYPGVSISVPVALTGASNVVAAQFDVAFNPARVTSAGALPTPASAQEMVLSREIAPGVRRVLVFSLNNGVITNRELARMPFTVAPQEYAGSGPLTPVNAILATDDASALVPVTLNSGTIFMRPVNLLPDGHVQFFLPATPDQRYFIQATTNLVDWINLSTNIATGAFLESVDVDAAAYPYRFYRWQAAE
jgi:Cohesin domain